MKMLKFLFISFVLIGCASMESETQTYSSLDIVQGKLITNMKGCENITLTDNPNRLYVSDLNGYIHLIDGTNLNHLSVLKSISLEKMVLGIDIGPDGYIYAASSDTEEWNTIGGGIYRIDPELENATKLYDGYPGINGLTISDNGTLYFAIGNLKLMNPQGKIYQMVYNKNTGYSQPEIFLDDLGSANGMYYDSEKDRLIFTETYKGVSEYNFNTGETTLIAGKSKVVEGFDDACLDSQGNIIIADPPYGFIKIYDPSDEIVRFIRIEGVGIASASQTRFHNGKEYVYITERITNAQSDQQDGRGLYIIPLDKLME